MTLQRDEFFSFWHAATEAVRAGKPLPPITDGKPQGGYYRTRRVKEGPWLPVEFDIDDAGEEILAFINGVPVTPAEHNKLWISCARHPVTWEDFESRMSKGHWPGEIVVNVEAPLSNQPPETPEAQLSREIDSAKEWLINHPIESDDIAHAAANRIRDLQKLVKTVEQVHEDEKKPHLEKCREVDGKYLPLIKTDKDPAKCGRAIIAINFIKSKLNAYAEKKDNLAREEARKAEVERQRLLKEATDRAVAVARETAGAVRGSGVETPPEPTVIPPELLVPTPPVAKQSFGGITGRKLAQGKRTVAVIVDQDACYKHFRDNPEVTAVLLKLANAMVKAKMTVPGVEEREESYVR